MENKPKRYVLNAEPGHFGVTAPDRGPVRESSSLPEMFAATVPAEAEEREKDEEE